MEDAELLKKAMEICRKTKNCSKCELYNVCCYTDTTPYRVEGFFKVLRRQLGECKKTGANIVRYPVISISITYATSSAFSENDKSSSTIFQV